MYTTFCSTELKRNDLYIYVAMSYTSLKKSQKLSQKRNISNYHKELGGFITRVRRVRMNA